MRSRRPFKIRFEPRQCQKGFRSQSLARLPPPLPCFFLLPRFHRGGADHSTAMRWSHAHGGARRGATREQQLESPRSRRRRRRRRSEADGGGRDPDGADGVGFADADGGRLCTTILQSAEELPDSSGVAQWLACWAHNPKVRGSKPRSATGPRSGQGNPRGHGEWEANLQFPPVLHVIQYGFLTFFTKLESEYWRTTVANQRAL